MIAETSGNVYKFPLAFDKGYAYAEILDYSDIAGFDGILMQVFGLIEKEKNLEPTIDNIKKHGIMFGPVSINKYPKITKNKWRLYGKDLNFDKVPPFFKRLKAAPSNNNWAMLSPWVKEDRFGESMQSIECEYEEVRELEISILNHVDSVIDKVTMMIIIEEGNDVKDYFDLNQLGNKNLYLQVVNTYYDKLTAEKLLAILG